MNDQIKRFIFNAYLPSYDDGGGRGAAATAPLLLLLVLLKIFPFFYSYLKLILQKQTRIESIPKFSVGQVRWL